MIRVLQCKTVIHITCVGEKVMKKASILKFSGSERLFQFPARFCKSRYATTVINSRLLYCVTSKYFPSPAELPYTFFENGRETRPAPQEAHADLITKDPSCP